MEVKVIELLPEEKDLYNQIFPFNYGSENIDALLERCQKLTLSLIERNAIPEHRLKYFNDSSYNLGRGNRSRAQIFEDNGRKGISKYRDASFVEVLHYFINGADFPKTVRDEASQIVSSHSFYPEDSIDSLKKMLLKYFGSKRTYPLPSRFQDKVFQLALDLSIPLNYASQLRQYSQSLK